jgi:hypothetical protein
VIADVLASYKLMKALIPEVVITGHGPATTMKVFGDHKRVGEMTAQGKSLDDIKKRTQDAGVQRLGWAGPLGALHRRGVEGGQEIG